MSDERIAEIERAIRDLEYDRRCWGEQVGMEGSDMKSSDVAFLDRQIARLKKEERILEGMRKVRTAVDNHRKDW